MFFCFLGFMLSSLDESRVMMGFLFRFSLAIGLKIKPFDGGVKIYSLVVRVVVSDSLTPSFTA